MNWFATLPDFGEAGTFVHKAVIATYRAPFDWNLLATALDSERLAPVAVLSRSNWSPGGMCMTPVVLNRRHLIAAGGSVVAAGVSGLLLPASAAGLARAL